MQTSTSISTYVTSFYSDKLISYTSNYYLMNLLNYIQTNLKFCWFLFFIGFCLPLFTIDDATVCSSESWKIHGHNLQHGVVNLCSELIYIHTYIRMCVCVCICIYMHTYMYIYTYIHNVHIYTYIYTNARTAVIQFLL